MNDATPLPENTVLPGNETVDATNAAALAGGTEEEQAEASAGNDGALGLDELATPDEIVAVLGESNRDATVTRLTLRTAQTMPRSAWNDPEYWPVMNSVNHDSVLAAPGKYEGVYVAIKQPELRP